MGWEEPKAYAVKHKDEEIRMASRSGGVFTALSDAVLNEGGIVYGCVLTEKFEAVHIRAEKSEDRDRMRGSKYIQSDMGDIFLAVRNDLDSERKVLFSGTSCQIAGLRAFLDKQYSNLICIDIVCHGVPSPLVWKKYLKWQEDKNGECVAVDFRDKIQFGWAEHVESLVMTNRKGKQKTINSQVFTKLFYGHSILRPCCYKCPYKSTMHPGDITIADYWGIEKAAPEFNDNKGVSLVLINNEIGLDSFHKIQGTLVYSETELKKSLQPPLIKPFAKPEKREVFWEDFQNNTFDKLVKKYKVNRFRTKIKIFIKRKRGETDEGTKKRTK